MPNTTSLENKVPAMFSHESVEAAVVTAVGNALHTIEPQLQKFATQVAHQAVDKSQDLAERAYKRVQRQPLMLLGLAAVALAGVALAMFAQNQTAQTTRQIH